jgi:peptidyl-prolyl cis-trans isomerase A (cyclophilin A)
VTRKNRKMRREEAANNPQPQAGSAPTSGTRPGAVLAVMAILFVVIVGGGLLVFWLTRGGGGPNPQVVIETSEGTIKVELFQRDSPITVKNFLQYVDTKHYDGTIFHRVKPGFMIQGGGFTPDMLPKGDPGRKGIRNEASNGLKNERGTLAMARTDKPDSATDQFFINLTYNKGLDRANDEAGVGYAVFGKVTEGMDVVDKIARVNTETRVDPRQPLMKHNDVPVTAVIIKSIRRLEKKQG